MRKMKGMKGMKGVGGMSKDMSKMHSSLFGSMRAGKPKKFTGKAAKGLKVPGSSLKIDFPF